MKKAALKRLHLEWQGQKDCPRRCYATLVPSRSFAYCSPARSHSPFALASNPLAGFEPSPFAQ